MKFDSWTDTLSHHLNGASVLGEGTINGGPAATSSLDLISIILQWEAVQTVEILASLTSAAPISIIIEIDAF